MGRRHHGAASGRARRVEGEGRGRANGVVMFQKLDDAHTKVKLRMAYEPEGMKQAIGSAFGIDSRRVKGDLESFKEFIEARGRNGRLARGGRALAAPSRGSGEDSPAHGALSQSYRRQPLRAPHDESRRGDMLG